MLSHCDVAAGTFGRMPRWEPHARRRLELSALDLYATRGYDSTTVGDIAAHAGVTSRTYFRYFPDKREVLFGSADELRDRIASALGEAPADLSPLAVALHAMGSCDELFHPREHERLRQRDTVIDTSGELQEREARKLASIAAVVAVGLAERGFEPDDARLVADLALVVFTRAARLWMADPATSFAVLLHRAAAQARGVLAGPTGGPAHSSSVSGPAPQGVTHREDGGAVDPLRPPDGEGRSTNAGHVVAG